MRLISVDAGLSGAIAYFIDGVLDHTVKMPIIKIKTKQEVKVLDLDSKGKKQVYKSGSKKGEFKYKIKTPAKYKTILDTTALSMVFANAEIIVIEEQNPRPGNSAMSSFTTGINYGRLLGAAEMSNAFIVTVTPAQWKKTMHITMTKDEKLALDGDKKMITHTLKAKACSLAKSLFKRDFVTPRGAMMDGEAEAALIGYSYIHDALK